MLVNSFQTWSEQNICVGYDPNNGQLMSLAGYDILAIDAAYYCT